MIMDLAVSLRVVAYGHVYSVGVQYTDRRIMMFLFESAATFFFTLMRYPELGPQEEPSNHMAMWRNECVVHIT